MEVRELELVKDRSIRDKYISRLDVLDKVGNLILLPSTDYATTEQVADYYEVGFKAIETIVNRHRDELNLDGFDVFKRRDVIELLNIPDECLESVPGKAIVSIEGISELHIPNRGLRLFPRKAILRVGMLLRDSEVAKEVRTYLLNVEHDAQQGKTDIVKNISKELSREEELLLAKAIAEFNSDHEEYKKINFKLFELKNKRINELETENKKITENALTIDESRAVIRRVTVSIGYDKHNGIIGRAWNEFYRQLNYKLNINIKSRDKGKGSYLDTLNDEEVREAELIARSWAIDVGLDLVKLLKL